MQGKSGPKTGKRVPVSQPSFYEKNQLLLLNMQIYDNIVQLIVKKTDTAYSLAHQFLKKVNFSRKFGSVSRISQLIEQNINSYTSHLKQELEQLGYQPNQPKHRTYLKQNPSFLNNVRMSQLNLQNIQTNMDQDQIAEIQVQLTDDIIGIIKIREGDDPDQLAQDFCEKYSIDKNNMEQIKKQIVMNQ